LDTTYKYLSTNFDSYVIQPYIQILPMDPIVTFLLSRLFSLTFIPSLSFFICLLVSTSIIIFHNPNPYHFPKLTPTHQLSLHMLSYFSTVTLSLFFIVLYLSFYRFSTWYTSNTTNQDEGLTWWKLWMLLAWV